MNKKILDKAPNTEPVNENSNDNVSKGDVHAALEFFRGLIETR